MRVGSTLDMTDFTAIPNSFALLFTRPVLPEIFEGGFLMKRLILVAALVGSTFLPMAYLAAHCEVPCGIYDDGSRIKSMLEDQATVAKAIAQINALADKRDGSSMNQLSRWVATKETHATNTQQVISQYFMTQKIKAGSDHYVEKLTSAHGVLVAAMKCKQSADPATAVALKAAIHNFAAIYSGQEPAGHSGHEHGAHSHNSDHAH